MPLSLDPTDPVMAAFHAYVVQGGYSTPAIEAERMKADCQRVTNGELIAWAEQAGLPIDSTREGLQRRLCDHIDARLAAYEQEGGQS